MSTKAPRSFFIPALIAAATAIGPLPALSQSAPSASSAPKCLQRSILVERLESRYNEQLSGGGLQSAQQLLEVWTSPQTGSFTVFITRADGLACIMATGQNWSSSAATTAKGVKS
ncbi:hypothetical protein [Thalassovita mediterranea]|jgi:hypothetical protein|uniref:Uncharacterized protein n=1 Tax=Thalassovita mediterranea TaxID=340021 RepID=A0A0P1H440_9RHOB|nr:hypothetical protein [Thalassovita mediterranea]CUH85440.1 hypothetical protein TM5383_02674 [Thalassovita mediterranea]SIS31685.1 hypothetical protein SAMN05421685_10524 [Thalassovita mediterranea]